MSLESLLLAQSRAAKLLGINITTKEFEELQHKEVHHLGDITLHGKSYPALRAYAGPKGKIGKGGIRFAAYPDLETGVEVAKELSSEMYAKLMLRNHHQFRGAKGLVLIDAWKLTPAEKLEVARQYADLMEKAGLVGHDKDVPAGDVGTNGLADEYARAHGERYPNDPYRHAVITGKTPKHGGLGARAGATGLGAFTAQKTIMEEHGQQQAYVSVQGFGNAGSWFAYYAASDPDKTIRIQAISEREGVLSTSDPEGLPITREMVQKIGDNLEWHGPKLEALAEMIRAEKPGIELELNTDPTVIFSLEVDYFVPAAMGDVITHEIAKGLGARLGVNEIANGPTTAEAHEHLVKSGKIIIPDFLSNSGGVDTSITEWKANIDLADGRISRLPDDTEVENQQRNSTAALTREVLNMAKRLGINDLRVAAVAVSMAHLQDESDHQPTKRQRQKAATV